MRNPKVWTWIGWIFGLLAGIALGKTVHVGATGFSSTQFFSWLVGAYVCFLISGGSLDRASTLRRTYKLVGDPAVYQTHELNENQKVDILPNGSRRVIQPEQLWFEMFSGHGSDISAEGWINGKHLTNASPGQTTIKTKGGALLYSEPDGHVIRRMPQGMPVTIGKQPILVRFGEKRWMNLKVWQKEVQ